MSPPDGLMEDYPNQELLEILLSYEEMSLCPGRSRSTGETRI